ncbi:DUF4837 family protein [Membranihabitans maritimus]|uniref:DUF4837 family protein n=1 Tax=Membranihabitans maritimus TaxID=2904244 RepID=UPI001F3B7870|nr:DUF4837 family protein [Membranihabitans maritimus]
MNLKLILLHIILLSGILLISGCGNGGPSGPIVKPQSMGKIYQVNVLSTDALINSPTMDTLDFQYGQAYPILPQPEPYFELRPYVAEDLDAQPVLRQLKCFLILADLSKNNPLVDMVKKDFKGTLEEKASGVKVGRDKWAQDQLLIYIYGPNESALQKEIKKSFPSVAREVEKFYQGMIRSTVFVQGINNSITEKINAKFGVDLPIPADYVTALETDSMIWLRQEIPDISRSILITKKPYKNPEEFSRQGFKEMRDRLGRYVSSTIEGTFMQINDEDLPLYINQVEIDDKYALRARGIWEIVGDFMGGSFVSYAILDEESQEVVLLDGFVYSPQKPKKLSMIYLDYILRQVQLAGN